jgi:Ca2+/H+ antiporter
MYSQSDHECPFPQSQPPSCHSLQTFQPLIARVNASTMNLAIIAILVPTTVGLTADTIEASVLQTLADAVAVVLIVVYGLSLLFSMKTHAYRGDGRSNWLEGVLLMAAYAILGLAFFFFPATG